MPELLERLFALLCGQNPDHTWAPGGLLLPCCQRCLGLYAGAGIAVWLHWRLRPKLSGRFLEVHGLMLLLMLPCGLHWLPQGPVTRTASGVLFGCAVVTFLWLPVSGVLARVRLGVRRLAPMPSGSSSKPLSRRDTTKIAQRFNAGTSQFYGPLVPTGRLKEVTPEPAVFGSALDRPCGTWGILTAEPSPAVAGLGYSQMSLRDKGHRPGQADSREALRFARRQAPAVPPATEEDGRQAALLYALGLAATLGLTPLLAAFGGRPAAYALSGLVLGGAAALALLILANAALAFAQLVRLLRPTRSHASPP